MVAFMLEMTRPVDIWRIKIVTIAGSSIYTPQSRFLFAWLDSPLSYTTYIDAEDYIRKFLFDSNNKANAKIEYTGIVK